MTHSSAIRKPAPRAPTVHLDTAELRRWGKGLDDTGFSRALAALGTILAAGAKATKNPALPADVRAPIPWDIGPILEPSGRVVGRRLDRFDAELLASAWQTAAVIAPVVALRGQVWISPPGSLEIRTPSLDLASLAWLGGLLVPASTQRGSYVAAMRIGSGPAFRYPIRVGTLADRQSQALHAALQRHFVKSANWLGDVVELVEVTGPASPVDLLLLPGSLDESVAASSSVRHGIEAGAVVVLGGIGSFARRSADELVNAFARAVDPWAIAIADIPVGTRVSWIDTVLEHLSHDETLDVAMQWTNAVGAKGRGGFVVADPASLAAMRVRAVAARMVDQLPRLSNDRVILPTEGAILLNAITVAPIGVGRGAVLEALQQPERYIHETGGARTVSVINRAIEAPTALEMYRGAVVFDNIASADQLGQIVYKPTPGAVKNSAFGAARRGQRAQPPVRGARAIPPERGRPHRERPKARARRGQRPARPLGAERPMRPPVAEPRYIQATISRLGSKGRPVDVSHALRPLTTHTLTVWIGPPVQRARHGKDPIDLTEVVADGGRHTLRVILALDGHDRPDVKTISVTAFGASSACSFDLDVPDAGRVRGRIIVQFRNRVLQTAILDAPVAGHGRSTPAASWTIETETVVRASLDHLSDRLPFDLAIVHNHDVDGDPTATLLHDDFVETFTATRLDANVANIQAWLSAAAEDPEPYDGLEKPDTIDLLVKLALQGVALRGLIVSDKDPFHLGDPDATPRVQVVAADPNAIFPIEFFYDFPPPVDDAKLCPNAVKALATGRCDPKHHGKVAFDGSIRFVCPAGFWSMNRVIERYASDRALAPDLKGRDFGVVNPERPIPRLSRLGPPVSAVFAWSDIVDRADADLVTASLRAAAKSAFPVRGWRSWVSRIANRRPNLLVLLAHTAIDKAGLTVLQIAKDADQSSGRFGRMFVRAGDAEGAAPEPGPIVLLLGCDTARAWNEYQSFVVLFKRHGAEIVVGTIATVAAKHAANVARRLVDQLAGKAIKRPGDPAQGAAFGDVLLRSRQGLLAEGEIMSLALTSYGDSDLAFG